MINEQSINKDVEGAVLALQHVPRDTAENHIRRYPERPDCWHGFETESCRRSSRSCTPSNTMFIGPSSCFFLIKIHVLDQT